MTDFWLENAAQPQRHVLVDCGYVRDAEARFVALEPHIGRKNFQRVGFGRLVARIPARKVQATLSALPQITPGADYCWCTHHFEGATP